VTRPEQGRGNLFELVGYRDTRFTRALEGLEKTEAAREDLARKGPRG
jgi:hypothetical protein